MAYNFTIRADADNTVRIPVLNPGGTLNAARLFVWREGDTPLAVDGLGVAFDANSVLVTIPASLANADTFKRQWTLMVSTDGGTNFVPGATGSVRVIKTIPRGVSIWNEELEVTNAAGAPLPIVAPQPLPVEASSTFPVSSPAPLSVRPSETFPVSSPSPLVVTANAAIPVLETATHQNVRGELETAARAGRGFAASTGVLTAGSLGTTNFRGTLSNPANSGKTLYITQLNTYASATAANVSLLINPTAGLPTTLRPVNNVYIGHPNTSVATMRSDASATAMTGGSDSGIRVPVVSGRPEQLRQPPYIVPPGVTLGLSGPFSASTELVVTIYWWEV